MTERPVRNVAASVRQRLLDLSRSRHEDFQFVLNRYGTERFLYRLALSPYADQFILKGATLFQLWTGQSHRPTRDLDLLGQGPPSAPRLAEMLRQVCKALVSDDGLTFDADHLTTEQIKEDDAYQGLRAHLVARLANARIPLQIDVGFGDAVTPAPQVVAYPALLEFPAPQLKACPRETVVAEKYQALVRLGIANSRMKDFYDIWMLARSFKFAGPTLCNAIQATFSRRQTLIPSAPPLGLTSQFSQDHAKRTQWAAFVRKGKLQEQSPPLAAVVEQIAAFLLRPTEALSCGVPFDLDWDMSDWK